MCFHSQKCLSSSGTCCDLYGRPSQEVDDITRAHIVKSSLSGLLTPPHLPQACVQTYCSKMAAAEPIACCHPPHSPSAHPLLFLSVSLRNGPSAIRTCRMLEFMNLTAGEVFGYHEFILLTSLRGEWRGEGCGGGVDGRGVARVCVCVGSLIRDCSTLCLFRVNIRGVTSLGCGLCSFVLLNICSSHSWN